MTSAEQGRARRAQIVNYVTAFHGKHGFYPTVREIAAGVGLVSPGATHRHLEILVTEGSLRRMRVTSNTEVYALP